MYTPHVTTSIVKASNVKACEFKPPAWAGMFDVDCSAMLSPVTTGIKPNASRGRCTNRPVVGVLCEEDQLGVGSQTHPRVSGNHNKLQNGVRAVGSVCEHLDVSGRVDTSEHASAKSRIETLLQYDTLVSLYSLSLAIGLVVIGIVGNAQSQQHVFISFAIFQGILLPTLVLHTLIVIENRNAAPVFGVCVAAYTPVSVTLSVLNETHVFVSLYFMSVMVFHVTTIDHTILKCLYVVIIVLFAWTSFSGFLDTPQRGDVVSLVVVPGLQIICVCITGIGSVLRNRQTDRL
jgi:hypothetical protein